MRRPAPDTDECARVGVPRRHGCGRAGKIEPERIGPEAGKYVDISNLISTSQIDGWDIALCVLSLLATGWAYRLTARGVAAGLDRIAGIPAGARVTIVRISKYLVLFLGIGIALTFLGAQLQPVLVVVVIVAVVVVLALRGIADNFSAGLVLQTRKPIDVGDEVQAQGYVGNVIELNGRSVQLLTGDGRIVHIPNSDMLNEPFVNNSANRVRRSEVQVRCTPPADLGLLDCVAAMTAAAATAPEVRSDPPPDGVLITADPTRLIMTVRFWHDPMRYVQVTSGVVAVIGEELRRRSWRGTVTSEHPDPPSAPADPV